MATPFQAFRKHQKAFMAIAAVLCMIIFVFASALSGGGGSPGGGRDLSAKVASWNGGALNEGELGRSMVERRILNDFLRRVYFEGMRAAGDAQTPEVPNFAFDPQASPDDVERMVLDTEIMADLARQAGITVSDSVINHYITEFGLRRVPTQQVQAILASVGRGDARANEAMVLSQLRKLLMAHCYRSSYGDSGFVVLPEQRWTDWRKVNERISLQAAILPTAEFSSQVGEPTEAQLRDLYNEFKDQEPNRLLALEGRLLESPDPGFTQPRKVKLHYISGNLDSWTERFRDQVTDEQIADYYERNKRTEFLKSSLPGTSDPMSFEEFQSQLRPALQGTDEAEAAEENMEPAAEEPAAEEPAAEEPAAEEPAAEEPATEEPATEEPAIEEPAIEEPAIEEPATEEPATEEPASSTVRRSPFQLASYQADESEALDEAAVENVEEVLDGASSSATDETVAAEEAAVQAESNDSPATAESTAPPSDAVADDGEPEYEPLEDVADIIRDLLARDLAVQAMERRIAPVTTDLQSKYRRYFSKMLDARQDETAMPEPPQDLIELSGAFTGDEFRVETLPLLSVRELASDTIIGRAFEPDGQQRTVAEAAFSDLEMYEPLRAKDLDGNWYIVTKVEDVPRKVPAFDDAQEAITAAWKEREAFGLAKKRAQELADQFTAATQTFNEFFSSQEVEVIDQTPLFSWWSYGLAQPGAGRPPSLGEAPPLEGVGPEFMQTAFGLEGEQVAVTQNHNHSSVYVVRVANREKPLEELRELFLTEQAYWPGQRDMLIKHQSEYRSELDDQLTQRIGLEFDEEWQARRRDRRE